MEDRSPVASPPPSPENAESPSNKKGKGFWKLRGKKSMGGLRSVANGIFKGRDRAPSKGSDQGYMPTVEERSESETGSQTVSRPPSNLLGRLSKLSNRADRTSTEEKHEPERFSQTSSHISSNHQENASARQSKSSSQAESLSVEGQSRSDRYSQTSSRSPSYRPAQHNRNIARPRSPAPEFPVEQRAVSDVFSQSTNQRPEGPQLDDPDDILAPGEVYEHNPEMKSTEELAKEYCDLIGSFDFDDDSSESDTTPTYLGNRQTRMPPPRKRHPPAKLHQRPSNSDIRSTSVEKTYRERPDRPREEQRADTRSENTERPLRPRPERIRPPEETITNSRPENFETSPTMRFERPRHSDEKVANPRREIIENSPRMIPYSPRDPQERYVDPRPEIIDTPVRARPERARISEERIANPRPEYAEQPPRTRPERPRVSEESEAQRDNRPPPEPMNAVQRRIKDLERGNMRGPSPGHITPDLHANSWMIAQQRLRDMNVETVRAEEAKSEESKRGLADSRPYNVQSTGTRRSDRDIEDETLSKARQRVRSNTKKVSPKGLTGLGLEFAATRM